VGVVVGPWYAKEKIHPVRGPDKVLPGPEPASRDEELLRELEGEVV